MIKTSEKRADIGSIAQNGVSIIFLNPKQYDN